MIKHLTDAKQLNKAFLSLVFDVAGNMEFITESRGRIDLLSDKVIAMLFLEPSSRTILSFQAAAERLRAGTIFLSGKEMASFAKRETLEDTIIVTAQYADLIILRTDEAGAADKAASVSPVPFINAGDGFNEHPTQALVDTYTIFSKLGKLDGLQILVGFDPLQSRAIHSLVEVLSQYPGNFFTFVCPEQLEPSAELKGLLDKADRDYKVLYEMPKKVDHDVIYLNRLQEERFSDPAEFERDRRRFVLHADMITNSRSIVLDPLPRIDEIDRSVDATPNATYFEQAKNGVAVRMALLAILLERYKK